jgi:hypothetical protein
MRTGSRAYFGPYFVSLGSLSPKQPNHGHFGTDVESSIIQWVGGHPKGSRFERILVGRSEPGSKLSRFPAATRCVLVCHAYGPSLVQIGRTLSLDQFSGSRSALTRCAAFPATETMDCRSVDSGSYLKAVERSTGEGDRRIQRRSPGSFRDKMGGRIGRTHRGRGRAMCAR